MRSTCTLRDFLSPALRVIAVCGVMGVAHATQIDALVMDTAGSGVSDAVVALYPINPSPDPAVLVTRATRSIDQSHKKFIPHVMAVQTGTQINFPNSDNVRHHVYSFSDAKRFELKLYAGKPANPILMDHPGLVVLGCNIHDWMRAYLYVLDTPFFSMTDAAGRAKLDVPPGDYAMKIWHPQHEAGHVALQHPLHVENDVQSLREIMGLEPVNDSSGEPPSAQIPAGPQAKSSTP